ncbi:MAG: class I tRNA ligase family protein [Patescibacteria group bacterium]
MSYNHKSIEKKWQERWEKKEAFRADDVSDKKKFYCLVEFPYPSGSGLHVGHVRSYASFDTIARKRRMQGFNVLYPIGWDAFGLPTENYAIKTGRKPQDITLESTQTFRRQLKALGLSFDWSREVNTTDPEYYKWTQWMFLQFFKAGLAYKAKTLINWCPKDKIGLANEEAAGGVCDRCGGPVEKREKEQWMIAITKYADRLLSDLDTVNYLPKIKKQQQDWIGKSEGAEIDFWMGSRMGSGRLLCIRVFTTRPDTIDGATYVVLAPEHPLVELLTTDEHREEVEAYVAIAKKRTEMERGDESREKTGVFTGSTVVNPFNSEAVPVWIADYVLSTYGTGAIMAVPQHDERDRAFAEKFGLPIVDRPLVAIDEVVAKVKGNKVTRYKLRDWVFSRQRYWGEPIPLVWCDEHKWVAVPDEQLPVMLPEVEKYEPTDDGESPLASIASFVNTTCPTCGKPAKRETDTMPNWAGSSWYFLRYIDAHNKEQFASADKLKHWMPVDLYNGGMEHTTLHLLYSRFWNKFLFDHGFVPTSEPYARRHSHGLVLSDDGTKMSKSKGNVVNPDDILEQYGADALRMYEMFMGPFEEPVPWSANGLIGVRRFLDKVWMVSEKIGDSTMPRNENLDRVVHKTIKKVSSDIEAMKFNTAVAELMKCVNAMHEAHEVSRNQFELFLKLLFPFAPHLASELLESFFSVDSLNDWPQYDPTLVKDKVITLAVQVNGKLRGTIEIAPEADQSEAETMAREQEQIARWLDGQEIKKVVYVSGRMINFVV